MRDVRPFSDQVLDLVVHSKSRTRLPVGGALVGSIVVGGEVLGESVLGASVVGDSVDGDVVVGDVVGVAVGDVVELRESREALRHSSQKHGLGMGEEGED